MSLYAAAAADVVGIGVPRTTAGEGSDGGFERESSSRPPHQLPHACTSGGGNGPGRGGKRRTRTEGGLGGGFTRKTRSRRPPGRRRTAESVGVGARGGRRSPLLRLCCARPRAGGGGAPRQPPVALRCGVLSERRCWRAGGDAGAAAGAGGGTPAALLPPPPGQVPHPRAHRPQGFRRARAVDFEWCAPPRPGNTDGASVPRSGWLMGSLPRCVASAVAWGPPTPGGLAGPPVSRRERGRGLARHRPRCSARAD